MDFKEDTSSFDSTYKIKLLTKNNDIVIYSLRDSIANNTEIINNLSNKVDKDIKSNVQDRIITYKVDSKNRVREIEFLNAKPLGSNAEYDADGESIGNVMIEPSAAIFNVDVIDNDLDATFVTDISYLVNESMYEGYYIENTDSEIDCVILTKGSNKINYSQDVCIIDSVTEITLDDDITTAKKIRYYTSSEDTLKEVIVGEVNDNVTEWISTEETIELKHGDLFMFAGGKIASAFGVIASYDKNTSEYIPNEKFIAKIEEDNNADTSFEFGYIDKWTTVSAGIRITSTDNSTFVIKNTANAYTTDSRNIYVNSWRKGNVAQGNNNFYVIRKIKNTVNDFIVCSKK